MALSHPDAGAITGDGRTWGELQPAERQQVVDRVVHAHSDIARDVPIEQLAPAQKVAKIVSMRSPRGNGVALNEKAATLMAVTEIAGTHQEARTRIEARPAGDAMDMPLPELSRAIHDTRGDVQALRRTASVTHIASAALNRTAYTAFGLKVFIFLR